MAKTAHVTKQAAGQPVETRVASSPPSSSKTYSRIEMRWSTEAREIQDLAELATKMKGNPTRRGEAAMHLVNMWSRVLHGELSPSAFWELFGVALPNSQLVPPMIPYATMPYPVAGIYPPFPAVLPTMAGQEILQQPSQEDPKEKAKRERIAKNRTQAEQWTS